MDDYKLIDKCLLCDGDTKIVFSLGKTPLANEFFDTIQDQDLFPLNLIQCIKCNHVQLDCIVDQERLYKNYSYVSGTSPVNVSHFEKYARSVMFSYYDLATFDDGDMLPIIGKNVDKTILDIGSNDGTFLKYFKKYGFDVIGVDPAANLKEVAKENGIDTITEFFNEETAKNIIKPLLNGKKIKVITCNNMFAHNENLYTIVEGIKELLDDDGIFVFENSYLLDMCEKSLIDLIYHEHMHHHHLKPLVKFFEKFDMEIFKVERLSNHGGSFRVHVCNKGMKNIQDSVNKSLQEENDINTKLENFEKNALLLKQKLNNRLNVLSKQHKIKIYGFPAKSTTLLYYFDINPDIIEYGIDDAKEKQGKFSPGKHIKIFSNFGTPKGGITLVLGWNFAESIIEKHKDYKGLWIVPLPEYIEKISPEEPMKKLEEW